MARGMPPPQIIVIKRRQIVVDQRIGMQHLQRRTQLFDSRGQRTRNHACRFQTQDRTQPLAAGKDAVPHGAVN